MRFEDCLAGNSCGSFGPIFVSSVFLFQLILAGIMYRLKSCIVILSLGLHLVFELGWWGWSCFLKFCEELNYILKVFEFW